MKSYPGNLVEEVARLRKISERQSAMLAQALKEKNDLQKKLNGQSPARFEDQIRRLQLDLSASQAHNREVRVAWSNLNRLMER